MNRTEPLERSLIILAVLIMLAFVAYASYSATIHSVSSSESLYRGTSKIGEGKGADAAAAHADCVRQMGKQTAAGTYSCKTPVTSDSVRVVPDPLLSWSAPTTNTDGSQLTDLAGYTVRYGICPSLDQSQDLPANAVTYAVPNLTQGMWCFSIESVNAAGSHGPASNVVSKTL